MLNHEKQPSCILKSCSYFSDSCKPEYDYMISQQKFGACDFKLSQFYTKQQNCRISLYQVHPKYYESTVVLNTPSHKFTVVFVSGMGEIEKIRVFHIFRSLRKEDESVLHCITFLVFFLMPKSYELIYSFEKVNNSKQYSNKIKLGFKSGPVVLPKQWITAGDFRSLLI